MSIAGLAVACAMALGLASVAQATTTPAGGGGTPSSASAHKGTGCAVPVPASERKSSAPYAQCDLVTATDSLGNQDTGSSTPVADALTPSDIRAAYNLPRGGSGETVAVVDSGGYASAEADLAVYRHTYGLPDCTTANGCFTKLDQNGGHNYPPDDLDWSVETALDLDAISAACPQCHILLVEGDSPGLDDLGQAENTAAARHPAAISNSYGVPGEGGSGADTVAAYGHYYDHPGIAVTASTGDHGNVVNWPASNGNVVAVGGTTLTRAAATTRGWTEAAWAAGGSGCSIIEPKPEYQQGMTTGCANRAISDISADADPDTGLGIYNSTPAVDGWLRVGGTSLSSPLVAAMYALAGTPTPGTYPVTYPYADTNAGDITDVTTGSDGDCGTLLCTSGPGWDGPTGLGTPFGVGALRQGPHGLVTGTVRSLGSRTTTGPVSGAAVTASDAAGRTYSATTDASGGFTLGLAPGTYTLTVVEFGFAKATETVQVAQGKVAKEAFVLHALPTHVVSGTVTDASGHGWPLAATITVAGYPGGAIATDPVTGRYAVRLPDNGTYTLHISATLPGYQTTDDSVAVGTGDVRHDVPLPVDANGCTTGYHFGYKGTTTDFEGWAGATPQNGWTVTDDSGSGITWRFDDPGQNGNNTGGTGQFAEVDSHDGGISTHETTSLVSPVLDLSGDANPIITFDNAFDSPRYNSNANVEVSIDGGQTWTSVWHMAATVAYGPEVVAIPQAAGKNNVRIRFAYDAVHSYYWQVDNVFIGNRSCDPTPGGLVAGTVADANTGAALSNATVSLAGVPVTTTAADGAYELFAPASAADASGRTTLDVTDGAYTGATAGLSVARDHVTRHDWRLGAGRISVSGGPVRAAGPLGKSTVRMVTFRNTGTAPVNVVLTPQDGTYTPDSHPGQPAKAGANAPVRHLSGTYTAGPLLAGETATAASSAAATTAAGTAWAPGDALPTSVMDSASVTLDGKVYTFGGVGQAGSQYQAYVHDPVAGGWKRLANMPQALEKPGAGAIDGKIYVVGGWDVNGDASAATYRYDPASDSWTSVASLPAPAVAGGTAVLGGRLYVIAGCAGNCAPASQATYVYDPTTDAWSQAADYPITDAWFSCAGIDAEVVCTGGTDPQTALETAATYAFDPTTGVWTAKAAMPYTNWGMASASADGRLQVLGGVTAGQLTNQTEEYDPATDTWSSLPAMNTLAYRASGACGLYVVGGATDNKNVLPTVEQLPGYEDCGTSGAATWLSAPHTVTVAPGATVTVPVTLNAGAVAKTGTYTSGLTIGTDTPYSLPALTATMKVR
ncbi:kelch repeat-containing protein [Catenulispora sp. MAP5-51]|uniref:kelch repeat-containing protein n=1 Tax=Catenulispora sp. MAP5-51 TaxID=3156298 RepID=UPI00351122A1